MMSAHQVLIAFQLSLIKRRHKNAHVLKGPQGKRQKKKNPEPPKRKKKKH